MASSYEDDKFTRYVRDMCRFVNLSTTQARVIDVAITIPYFDRDKQPVTLSATRRLPIPDARIGPVLPDRFDPLLTFPIRIEPNGVVEGRIEFEVPQGVEGSDLDVFAATATVKEARSHLSRRIGADQEVYDAREARSYAGRIGEPRPVLGTRLRRWARWMTGRPLPKLMSLGEAKAEAITIIAEKRQLPPPAPLVRAILEHTHEEEEKARLKVASILPRETIRATPRREVRLAEALGWIVYGEWRRPYLSLPFTAALAGHPPLVELLEELRKRAARGSLTIWGKRGGIFKKIPSSHWSDHALGVPDVVGGVSREDGGLYQDLMLNKAEVEGEWPHE
jgi:hypothetical protein